MKDAIKKLVGLSKVIDERGHSVVAKDLLKCAKKKDRLMTVVARHKDCLTKNERKELLKIADYADSMWENAGDMGSNEFSETMSTLMQEDVWKEGMSEEYTKSFEMAYEELDQLSNYTVQLAAQAQHPVLQQNLSILNTATQKVKDSVANVKEEIKMALANSDQFLEWKFSVRNQMANQGVAFPTASTNQIKNIVRLSKSLEGHGLVSKKLLSYAKNLKNKNPQAYYDALEVDTLLRHAQLNEEANTLVKVAGPSFWDKTKGAWQSAKDTFKDPSRGDLSALDKQFEQDLAWLKQSWDSVVEVTQKMQNFSKGKVQEWAPRNMKEYTAKFEEVTGLLDNVYQEAQAIQAKAFTKEVIGLGQMQEQAQQQAEQVVNGVQPEQVQPEQVQPEQVQPEQVQPEAQPEAAQVTNTPINVDEKAKQQVQTNIQQLFTDSSQGKTPKQKSLRSVLKSLQKIRESIATTANNRSLRKVAEDIDFEVNGLEKLRNGEWTLESLDSAISEITEMVGTQAEYEREKNPQLATNGLIKAYTGHFGNPPPERTENTDRLTYNRLLEQAVQENREIVNTKENPVEAPIEEPPIEEAPTEAPAPVVDQKVQQFVGNYVKKILDRSATDKDLDFLESELKRARGTFASSEERIQKKAVFNRLKNWFGQKEQPQMQWPKDVEQRPATVIEDPYGSTKALKALMNGQWSLENIDLALQEINGQREWAKKLQEQKIRNKERQEKVKNETWNKIERLVNNWTVMNPSGDQKDQFIKSLSNDPTLDEDDVKFVNSPNGQKRIRESLDKRNSYAFNLSKRKRINV